MKTKLIFILTLISHLAFAQQWDSLSFDLPILPTDTLFQKSINKADSITTSFQTKADSLNNLYQAQFNKIDAHRSKLQNKIDSLNNLKLPTEKLTHKLDSLNQLKSAKLSSLTKEVDDLKAKATSSFKEITLPPQMQEPFDKLKSSVQGYSLPALNANTPGLPSGNLPSLTNTKLPTLSNQLKLDTNLKGLGNLNQVNEFAGKAGEYTQDAQNLVKGNLDEVKNIDKTLESKVAGMEGVDQLTKGQGMLGQANQLTDSAAMQDKMKELAKEQIMNVAQDHFAGKQEVLQQAMDKMSKLKSRYSEVKSMAELPKKLPNPLKGKPLIERLVPGVTFQILKSNYFLLDVNALLLYRITPRLSAGAGWNQRLPFDDLKIKKEERIYVAGYELYKKHSGTDAGLERVSLSLMDAGHRFVMVETRNGINDGTEKQLVRYQLHNHLGSAALELDGTLDAKVISYEEYHPFGTTAYQAKNQDIKSAAKRYRYTGMERDEETGMEYHSARYYLPWLGRWLSADPIWIEGGENIYRYGRNNPVKMTDLSGNQPAEIFSPETALVAATALQRAAQVWGTAGIFTGGAAVAAPAIVAAPAAGAALPVAAAVTYALAISGAMIGALHIYMGRTGSIARYGNPYGMPSRDIAFPVLRAAREMRADPFPIPPPLPAPAPEGEERRRPRLEGRIYVTYTRYNPETGLTYSGRTSAVIDLNMPWRPQADAAVAARDANHHIDERPEPTASSFLPARLDQFAVGYAVGYGERYRDAAYLAIRGREQQLIDHYGATRAAELGSSATFTGGAWTDSNPGPHLTENNFRGVARDNLLGPVFHAASDLAFRPLASYTGDINP